MTSSQRHPNSMGNCGIGSLEKKEPRFNGICFGIGDWNGHFSSSYSAKEWQEQQFAANMLNRTESFELTICWTERPFSGCLLFVVVPLLYGNPWSSSQLHPKSIRLLLISILNRYETHIYIYYIYIYYIYYIYIYYIYINDPSIEGLLYRRPLWDGWGVIEIWCRYVDSLWVVRGQHICIAHEVLVVASMRLLQRYFIGSNTM